MARRGVRRTLALRVVQVLLLPEQMQQALPPERVQREEHSAQRVSVMWVPLRLGHVQPELELQRGQPVSQQQGRVDEQPSALAVVSSPA